jgi:Mn2+/Fe2+ NRAMP family transporter
MKFFGLSASSVPSSAKYVYVAIFGAIVVGSIWYLMSKVDQTGKSTKNNKRRKSPGKNTTASSPAAATASPTKNTKK